VKQKNIDGTDPCTLVVGKRD